MNLYVNGYRYIYICECFDRGGSSILCKRSGVYRGPGETLVGSEKWGSFVIRRKTVITNETR